MNNEEEWSDWLITHVVKHHESGQKQLVSSLVVAPNKELAIKSAAEIVHSKFASGSVMVQVHALLRGDGMPMSFIAEQRSI